MKKLSFLMFALAATMMMFAQEATAYKVTWVTNGVELPAKPTSNQNLWEAFMPAYNAYYAAHVDKWTNRGNQPIDKVSTFAAAKMEQFMTDENSDWKWLGDYVLSIATAAGKTLSGEGAWRWGVHAFFNAAAGANGAAGIDYTEAGKYENWIGVWKAANLLPETMSSIEAMPVLEKPEYDFLGWFDNEACTGTPVTKVTKECTLYAGWVLAVYHVDFVAPYASPNTFFIDDVYELAYAFQEDFNTANNSKKEWAKIEDGQVSFKYNGKWYLPDSVIGKDPADPGFIFPDTYTTTGVLSTLLTAEGSRWAWLKDAIHARRAQAGMTAEGLADALYRKEVGAMFLQSPSSTTKWQTSVSWEGFTAVNPSQETDVCHFVVLEGDCKNIAPTSLRYKASASPSAVIPA